MEQGRFRVGPRVDDVAAAARFYGGLGFAEVGTVPDDHGRPLMTILERDGVLLIADALEGMPFADSDRERATRDGRRASEWRSDWVSTTLPLHIGIALPPAALSRASRATRPGVIGCSS